MGEGTDPRTFLLGVRTVILRESRTTAVEGVGWDYSCSPIARLAESKIETSWERIKSEKEKEKGGKEK